MKKFTVKDFILYNAPCFSCKEPVAISIISTRTNDSVSMDGAASPVQLRATVTNENLEVDLKISYDQILKLFVNLVTNKIITTNFNGLTDYLKEHKLSLRNECKKCYTSMDSYFLEFNLNKGFVYPVGIAKERLMVTDDMNQYTVISSFFSEQSILYADRLDKTHPITPLKIELPLIPLYRFGTREKFLNKIKTYLIFS